MDDNAPNADKNYASLRHLKSSVVINTLLFDQMNQRRIAELEFRVSLTVLVDSKQVQAGAHPRR